MKALTVGLEITDEYLKLAAVSLKGASRGVHDCIVKSLAVSDDDKLIKSLTEISHQWKFKSKSLVVCLPRNTVTVRNIPLPSQDKKEITSMIGLHVARIVPYRKEEICFGYSILGKDEVGYTKVVAAIAHAPGLNRQVKLLEAAGFLVDSIALSSYGAWNWAIHRRRLCLRANEVYLLLDVDANFTDFIVCTTEKILFTRSINIGAVLIKADRVMGIKKFLGEIKQSLVIFYNEETNKKPARIFISGSSLIKEAAGEVAQDIGIEAEYVAAASGEQLKAGLTQEVSFSGVSGLLLGGAAATRINFELPEIQIRKSLRQKSRDLFTLGALIIFILAGVCLVFTGRIYHQQKYVLALQAEALAIEGEVGEIAAQLDKIGYLKKFFALRRKPLYALSLIYGLVPREISVTYWGIDQGSIILRAQALELSGVFNFVTTLEQSQKFAQVQTKYTRRKRVKEQELTEFELNFILAD